MKNYTVKVEFEAEKDYDIIDPESEQDAIDTASQMIRMDENLDNVDIKKIKVQEENDE